VRFGRLVIVLLAGCRPATEKLSQVEPTGGSPAQHQAAVAGLVEVESWLADPSEILLSGVAFVPSDDALDGALGGYDSTRQRIGLSDELTASQVRTVLRHELCHAWDHQAGWVSDGWPSLAEVRNDLPIGAFDDDLDAPRWRWERREALATLCESEPLAIRALLTPCGHVSDALTDAAQRVTRQVWPRAPDWATVSAVGEVVLTAEPTDAWPDGCSTDAVLRSAGIFDDFLRVAADVDDRELVCWETAWPGGASGQPVEASRSADDEVVQNAPFSVVRPVAVVPGGLGVYSVTTAGGRSEVLAETRDGLRWGLHETERCVERTSPVVATTAGLFRAQLRSDGLGVDLHAVHEVHE
jgi:hypothetical protein